MPPEDFFDKYPRTKKFLEQHPGMSLDEALVFVDVKLQKLEGKNEG